MRYPALDADGEQDGTWTFLTNHAVALIVLCNDPDVRLSELADRLEVTERAAHRIVRDLVDGGYVRITKRGRRNHYEISAAAPLRRRSLRDVELELLLGISQGSGSRPSPVQLREDPPAGASQPPTRFVPERAGRGSVAAHAVYAATGERGGAAEIEADDRRAVGRRGNQRAEDDLPQVVGTTADVARLEVRIE
jgi:DNA-binding MarR family transcriptional regulator